MKRLFAATSSVLLCASPVLAQPTRDEVERFHGLVQTGGAAAVEQALKQNPALATAEDRYQFQAIHMLDHEGFEEVLRLLLDHGADINAPNDVGHTLLHVLIDAQFVPTVIAAGTDPDAKDKQGRTPLALALTEPDSFDMVEALLAGGADPNVRDNQGQTSLGFAKKSNGSGPAIVDLLVRFGASE